MGLIVTDDILTIATMDAIAQEALRQLLERVAYLEEQVAGLREQDDMHEERLQNLEDVTDAVTDEDDA